ncbi:hypothetical protein K469DRAFT_705922 [Zopfia rhizophila CBS 207.26]|uniref:Uncharacterized protein n=1 Tax=Zopfia rhizophila CBS 207.26 TaxID=1314779 RepID=A0A6A6ESC0_9PEZI|nr:hypothetical protein K469DRAFT_705922 [Zopfia rhizophila CBS 207.26]
MSSTPITHIVLFKYKSNITWSDFQHHFHEFSALQEKCLHPSTNAPYMLSLRMGQNNSWEPYSKGMTHGFVLEFVSQADLDYYLFEDPVHRAFSEKALPLIEDSVVVDIKDAVLCGLKPEKPVAGVRMGLYRGSCHCGELNWEVRSKERIKHVLCHCDTCKKLGGAPYSCNFIVPREDLAITKGQPGIYTYKGASGKNVRCFFCSTCTSHIYHHQDAMSDKVIVRTLLLDCGNDLDAGGEIFPEGKLKWADALREALNAPVAPVSIQKKAVNGVNGANSV